MSVTTTGTNSLSQDYINLEDHILQTSIDTQVETIYFINHIYTVLELMTRGVAKPL